MRGWKTIASLFLVSASAAILGVACTAQVNDPNEPDEAMIADESQAADDATIDDATIDDATMDDATADDATADDAMDEATPARPGNPGVGGGFGTRRCVKRCRNVFAACLRSRRGDRRRCERVRRECVERCGRRRF